MKSKPSKLKQALQVISGLLSILKFLPLGNWRNVVIALSAAVGSLIALVERCDTNPDRQPPTQSLPTAQPPTPTPTPTHTPSPTPSPKPSPRIIVPESITAGEPFVVKVTAPFAYQVNLTVDRFHLCILGQEYRTKHFACTVTLWTAGKRTLKVTLPTGEKLERDIEVARPRADGK